MGIAEFVLKSKYFEFNSIVKHEVSGAAIGAIFAWLYAHSFWIKLKENF